jgi:hypothetical protein
MPVNRPLAEDMDSSMSDSAWSSHSNITAVKFLNTGRLFKTDSVKSSICSVITGGGKHVL